MDLLLASCASNWGIGLVIVCGLHAVSTIGVTGGPNHGEHPFLANFVHLLVAAWALWSWPRGLYWSYLGLVFVGVVGGLFCIGLVGARPAAQWAARLGMAALYAALLTMLLRR